MNDGDEIPEVSLENLSNELMHNIKTLRNLFYETKRGRVDYHALKKSDEYLLSRLMTNGLQKCDYGIARLGIDQSIKEVADFFSYVKYVIGDSITRQMTLDIGSSGATPAPGFGL